MNKYANMHITVIKETINDRQAFENPNFRKLLKQAVLYVWNKS